MNKEQNAEGMNLSWLYNTYMHTYILNIRIYLNQKKYLCSIMENKKMKPVGKGWHQWEGGGYKERV
jgi:hypothetical protein